MNVSLLRPNCVLNRTCGGSSNVSIIVGRMRVNTALGVNSKGLFT